jgi:tetratricopeptide (TPR) repeat protein
VLSGPYGPNFSLITSLPSVIHMFGVASIDPWLFRKYPITHLLLDEPNEDLARKNYPEVMSNAAHFRTFFIGNRKVRLFRIAGSTGNPIADSYKLSDLERAIVAFTDGSEAGNEPALRFATSHPNNVSSILLMGERADVMGEVEVAASMFQKAVEISPTNANLYVRAGTFFKDKWLETGDSDMREKAKKYLERGAYFAPNTPSITRSIAELDMPRETLLKSKERDDE